MKIKLKQTPAQVELVKAMASRDSTVAAKAREAFAAFIGPVISQVLDLMGTSNLIYTDLPFDEDTDPTFALDLFYNASIDTVTVWQQSVAGGLGTSLVTGLQEMKLSTYRLDSAVSLLEKNIRRGQLSYVSLAMNRLSQELLAKQERNKWLIALRALGEGQTNGNKHTIGSTTANILQVDDFNRLLTRGDRINVSFNQGTPVSRYSNGITDLFLSPEMMEQIRGFAYQPMNTRAHPNTDESTAVPLPDNIREQVYRSAGLAEIYGITLHKLIELGVNGPYNQLFDRFDDSVVAGGNSGTFASGTDEILVGVDSSREALLRPVETHEGGTVVTSVDDQFAKRSGKIGWFSSIQEGAVCVDSKVLLGLAV